MLVPDMTFVVDLALKNNYLSSCCSWLSSGKTARIHPVMRILGHLKYTKLERKKQKKAKLQHTISLTVVP